jgi:hypothetical protein
MEHTLLNCFAERLRFAPLRTRGTRRPFTPNLPDSRIHSDGRRLRYDRQEKERKERGGSDRAR